MRGQGSRDFSDGCPGRLSRQPRARRPARWMLRLALIWAVAWLGMGAGRCLFSAEQQLRIRIAWGGGAARAWVGSISVSQGAIRQVTLLGVEADDPGSVWVD